MKVVVACVAALAIASCAQNDPAAVALSGAGPCGSDYPSGFPCVGFPRRVETPPDMLKGVTMRRITLLSYSDPLQTPTGLAAEVEKRARGDGWTLVSTRDVRYPEGMRYRREFSKEGRGVSVTIFRQGDSIYLMAL